MKAAAGVLNVILFSVRIFQLVYRLAVVYLDLYVFLVKRDNAVDVVFFRLHRHLGRHEQGQKQQECKGCNLFIKSFVFRLKIQFYFQTKKFRGKKKNSHSQRLHHPGARAGFSALPRPPSSLLLPFRKLRTDIFSKFARKNKKNDNPIWSRQSSST